MFRNRRIRSVVACGGVLLAACGGDNGVGTSSEADGTMSATVGETLHWSSSRSVAATLRGDELVITGVERSGHSIKLDVFDVVMNPTNPDVEQRFVLTGMSSIPFGFAQYSEGASDNFATNTTGGSGTIVITRLTATRVVGTFTFVGVRVLITGSGPGQEDLFRRVSVGVFDVRLQ
jgi:hypothetical protein